MSFGVVLIVGMTGGPSDSLESPRSNADTPCGMVALRAIEKGAGGGSGDTVPWSLGAESAGDGANKLIDITPTVPSRISSGKFKPLGTAMTFRPVGSSCGLFHVPIKSAKGPS
eukprot:scaffold82990_cov63-Attheya_sp.AAC.1